MIYIFKWLRYIFTPKLNIFLDVKDDDNYDEEGGNQPERTFLLKRALKKARAYCQLHDFQNSVGMIENDCVKATYHQSNIQKHITDFFKLIKQRIILNTDDSRYNDNFVITIFFRETDDIVISRTHCIILIFITGMMIQ